MEDNSLSSIAGVDVQTVLKDYDYTVGVDVQTVLKDYDYTVL